MSTKFFFDFDLIWCMGRPRPDMRTSVRAFDQIQVKTKSRSLWISENRTFLDLSPPPFSHGAQNWWLTVIVLDLTYTACLSPIFEFPSRKSLTWVQTSWNVDISRNSNNDISVLRKAIVTWLGMLVVLYVLCMLIWPSPDLRSKLRGF